MKFCQNVTHWTRVQKYCANVNQLKRNMNLWHFQRWQYLHSQLCRLCQYSNTSLFHFKHFFFLSLNKLLLVAECLEATMRIHLTERFGDRVTCKLTFLTTQHTSEAALNTPLTHNNAHFMSFLTICKYSIRQKKISIRYDFSSVNEHWEWFPAESISRNNSETMLLLQSLWQFAALLLRAQNDSNKNLLEIFVDIKCCFAIICKFFSAG